MTRPAGRSGGFQRGPLAPFGTRLCEAKCSVLYLLARLMGEAGCGAFAPRFPHQENGRGFCERERTKSLSVFGERRQVYKPPSLVPRVETYIEMRYVSANTRREEHRPSAPKIKGGGQAPLVLARLTHHKANPGGAVKVGAESAMHFNLDGPARVCYCPGRNLSICILFWIRCLAFYNNDNSIAKQNCKLNAP